MPQITIDGQVISFPNSATDANWAPPVIQFAEAVEEALFSITNPYNVPYVVQILGSNANTNVPLQVGTVFANFPNQGVASFTFTYTVYRQVVQPAVHGTPSQSESGVIVGTYDTQNSGWILQQEWSGDKYTNGVSYYTFSMNSNQLQFTSIAMPINLGDVYDVNNSRISYSASSQLVVNQ